MADKPGTESAPGFAIETAKFAGVFYGFEQGKKAIVVHEDSAFSLPLQEERRHNQSTRNSIMNLRTNC